MKSSEERKMPGCTVIARASTADFKWSPAFRTFYGVVGMFGSKMRVFGGPDYIELESEKTGKILEFKLHYVLEDEVLYKDTEGKGLEIALSNIVPSSIL
jgi:hypothetical protein